MRLCAVGGQGPNKEAAAPAVNGSQMIWGTQGAHTNTYTEHVYTDTHTSTHASLYG